MTLTGTKDLDFVSGFLRLRLEWTATQNTTNNSSSVTASLRLIGLRSDSTINAGASNTGHITINGTTVTFTNTSALSGTQNKLLGTSTVTVYHNTDGTKDLTVSADYNVNVTFSGTYHGVKSISGTWTLDTIPRASTPTLSASSFNVGDTITINTNRASTSFTHTIRYTFGTMSGTIASGITTSTTWAVPKTLANMLPTAVSGSGKIIADTYSGATLVGTKSVNFVANVPDTAEFRPTVTNLSVAEATAGIAAKFNAYIQGQSTLAISYTPVGSYTSSIVGNTIQANGQELNDTSATTAALTTSGTQTITAMTSDSRKRYGATTQDITVLAYVRPQITALVVQRCNQDGTINSQGAYAKVDMVASITPLNNLNDKVATLRYRPTGTTTWMTQSVTPVSGYTLNNSVILSSIDVNKTYELQLQVYDYFDNTLRTASIPTAFTLVDFHSSGTGLTLGAVAENPNRFDVKLPMHVYAPTDTEDAGFIRLRRSDGTVLGYVTTGKNGTGLKLHMYDRTEWKSVLMIAEDGTVMLQGDIPWTDCSVNGAVSRYKVSNKRLYLEIASTPAINAGTKVANIPVSLLPKSQMMFPIQAWSSNTADRATFQVASRSSQDTKNLSIVYAATAGKSYSFSVEWSVYD